MTNIEKLVRSELDRRYPRPAGKPDWDDVLHRATGAAAPDRPVASLPSRARRWRLVFALAAAVLAAAAASLALVAPWNGAPDLTQQALAALGNGRYVHAVFESTNVVRRLDLASGQERPLRPLRAEWVYDTKTKAITSRFVAGGLSLAFGGHSLSDGNPAISGFVTGYRTALANGKARVVATKTVYGEKAVILRFKTSDGLYEDVAVSTATHVPLRVSHGSFGGRGNPVPMGPTWRVLAIDSSRTWTRLPKAVVIARSMTAFDTYIRRVSVSTARAALGHTPVWPGPVVAGTTTLRSIELDRLTTTIGRNTSAARGLHLNYRGPQGALTVQEAAKAEAAGGFLTPKYGLDLYPIPAAGQALVVSDSYRIAGGPAHLTWRAELRTHGLYVTISSTSRSLVVAAARALAPMR